MTNFRSSIFNRLTIGYGSQNWALRISNWLLVDPQLQTANPDDQFSILNFQSVYNWVRQPELNIEDQ
jgi:hypothetical protein